ncbi:hypothetical protein Taro_055197 [Colocasia esculenta]|uniref:Uncharacterized protein n=1 Tax=Colocasia esculenta TaxID=4460 RepID=A0A843XQU0_COLES|nr:hypothetical protein [Colocasia esculenta]
MDPVVSMPKPQKAKKEPNPTEYKGRGVSVSLVALTTGRLPKHFFPSPPRARGKEEAKETHI